MQKTVWHTTPKICYYLALYRKGLSTPGIYRSTIYILSTPGIYRSGIYWSTGFNGDKLYMVNGKEAGGSHVNSKQLGGSKKVTSTHSLHFTLWNYYFNLLFTKL